MMGFFSLADGVGSCVVASRFQILLGERERERERDRDRERESRIIIDGLLLLHFISLRSSPHRSLLRCCRNGI